MFEGLNCALEKKLLVQVVDVDSFHPKKEGEGWKERSIDAAFLFSMKQDVDGEDSKNRVLEVGIFVH